MNCWWKSFASFLSLVFTPQIELNECCVWFQYFTHRCCSCISNLVVCWKGKCDLLIDVFRVPFVFTIECEIIKWCVDFQCFTQCCCSSVSDAVICWFVTDATTWMTNECKKGSRVLTSQIEVNECWVCLQHFTKCCCSSVSDVVICSFNEEWKKTMKLFVNAHPPAYHFTAQVNINEHCV